MSTIQQSCPECSRVLELPADATGRLAQCPACESTFRIGEPGLESVAVGASSSVADSARQPDQADESAQPRIVKVGIEEILHVSWAIFKKRWPISVGACAIVAFVALLAIGIPSAALYALSAKAGLVALIGIMLMVPYSLAFGAYALVGLCRVHLAIARDESSPLSELMPPMHVVTRFLPSYILLFLLTGGVLGLSVVGIAFAAASGHQDLANALGVILTFVLTVLGTILQWYLWSWMMVGSDAKTTALGSLSVAGEITMQNKFTSFFLIIVAVVLSLIGSLMCYVGHLLTTPLTLTMFAVGYLRTTNQNVVDPAELDDDPTLDDDPNANRNESGSDAPHESDRG